MITVGMHFPHVSSPEIKITYTFVSIGPLQWLTEIQLSSHNYDFFEQL